MVGLLCVFGVWIALGVSAAALPESWSRYLDPPKAYAGFERKVRKVRTKDCSDFTVEWYLQRNGPDSEQRVMLAVPKRLTGKVPCVVVPYYFPEAMLGEETNYVEIAYVADLARRGYAAASAEAYHLTYATNGSPADVWAKWRCAGESLKRDWPMWTGIGKLTFDTRLVIDLVAADPRVDADRIGILGHSLGGKMAFYAGCLDPRVKAIVASDFGIGWTQTNWDAVWYWGERVAEMRAAGRSHAELLTASGGKPFCLIAGKYDDADSGAIMRAAKGYDGSSGRLLLLHHGRDHRPPPEMTDAGYRFLDRWLK